MIADDRLTTYIHSLESDNSPFLEELREYAKENDVPIIRRETESFIRVLLNIKQPKKILEIGTAIGYSAIFMAGCAESEIVTIENYEKRILQAEKNIKKADMQERIRLLKGDAGEIIKTLEGSFDMIFLDAAKAQYIEMLPHLLRLLAPNGILLADNVLQDGNLVQSRFITERRQRTIHERMREFLWEIKHNEMLKTSVLTVGDGLSLSVKKLSEEPFCRR